MAVPTCYGVHVFAALLLQTIWARLKCPTGILWKQTCTYIIQPSVKGCFVRLTSLTTIFVGRILQNSSGYSDLRWDRSGPIFYGQAVQNCSLNAISCTSAFLFTLTFFKPSGSYTTAQLSVLLRWLVLQIILCILHISPDPMLYHPFSYCFCPI